MEKIRTFKFSYWRRCMKVKEYEIEQNLITVYIMATHVPVY